MIGGCGRFKGPQPSARGAWPTKVCWPGSPVPRAGGTSDCRVPAPNLRTGPRVAESRSGAPGARVRGNCRGSGSFRFPELGPQAQFRRSWAQSTLKAGRLSRLNERDHTVARRAHRRLRRGAKSWITNLCWSNPQSKRKVAPSRSVPLGELASPPF